MLPAEVQYKALLLTTAQGSDPCPVLAEQHLHLRLTFSETPLKPKDCFIFLAWSVKAGAEAYS